MKSDDADSAANHSDSTLFQPHWPDPIDEMIGRVTVNHAEKAATVATALALAKAIFSPRRSVAVVA